MTHVVISPTRVADFEDGGGHFWVYLQYAVALRAAGCELRWLERIEGANDTERCARLGSLRRRLEPFGLGEAPLAYAEGPSGEVRFLGIERTAAERVLRAADLLLNFRYDMRPDLLGRFRRTALVDIDPGLLQLWVRTGQLRVGAHDRYFSIGETVGTPAHRFPGVELEWKRIRPPVCLELWPACFDERAEAFTTVSGWSGPEWILDEGTLCENTKRASFLEYLELPKRTSQPLELALDLGASEPDASDLLRLRGAGWRVRSAREVAGSPARYRAYLQASRGEFGCAKPFHRRHRTAWVSDRTICYLASGKPAIVEDTGPSAYLPNGEGLLRFSSLEEAAEAIRRVDAAYAQQCRAARAIAEAFFDARPIIASMLDHALG